MSETTDTTTPVLAEQEATDTKPVTTRGRRRDPLSVFGDFDEMMDRMLNRRWPLFRSLPGMSDIDVDWNPHVDMYEQGDELVVKAELPGVAREDIDVSIEKGDLIIKGERKSEHEVKDEHAYRMERSFGSFYRRLPLPDGVKDDEISATFADGVLEIRTPKPSGESPASKKVPIN